MFNKKNKHFQGNNYLEAVQAAEEELEGPCACEIVLQSKKQGLEVLQILAFFKKQVLRLLRTKKTSLKAEAKNLNLVYSRI